MKKSVFKWVFFVCVMCFLGAKLIQCSVSYDRKAIVINGQRRILISGSIHYPRSTPEMWGDLINKAKKGGLDVVDTYVFWNVHEPSPGNYNFEGRYDLVRFIKTIQQAGLYAHLRIGPYICAEWNFGGFPVWLKYVPGISFRTDNEPFKMHMQRFTEKIVGLMKSERLFESQGGPIILSQIENEYGPQVKLSGYPAQQYMTWAAKMAVGLNTGVPWVMCKEEDAPDPLINTCNGVYCDAFTPNRPYKPTLWTEAWTGWFTEFGGPIHERPVEDLAFAVAKFIQKGGSFVNYYMFHGGTNFGRSAGGPFITTSYDYDAPLDEYGLIKQPKYGHLKELHKAIKLCERALLSADPMVTSLGNLQQAHVFSSKTGGCAAFLSNYDSQTSVKVMFNDMHYSLPPWSISILPDCKIVVFNTAKVEVQASKMEMLPTNSGFFSWGSYSEDLSSLDHSSSFTTSGLLEQINVTRDTTDYLWYSTSVDISPSESSLHGGELPTLIVQSSGHALHVFINGHRTGSYFGKRKKRSFMFKEKINLQAGRNKIALLSVAVGLPNVGVHYETWKTGVLGPVAIEGLDKGKWDLSLAKWTYKVGLEGEAMKNFGFQTAKSPILWTNEGSFIAKRQQQQHPLMWHKAYFNAPDGDEPLALDMSSMGKGQIWINGQNLGRYWTLYAVGNCNKCSYIGPFHSSKCQLGCGQPTQRWYHVPRSWLNPTRNLLVLFEELGGDPTRIMLSFVCTDPDFGFIAVLENIYPVLSLRALELLLGSCGRFQQGSCHAMESYSILKKKCLGQQKCSVTISNNNFGQDPCPNVLKHLSVEAICSPV